MKNILCKFRKVEKGSISVLIAFSFLMLIGVGAWVTDAGIIYINANQIQNAADAAALAGAEELPLLDDSTWNDSVVSASEKYAKANNIDSVVVSPVKNSSGKIIGVEVKAEKTVNNMLIKVLSNSNDTVEVSRRAVARIFTVQEVSKGSGLIPVGINADIFSDSGFDGSIVLDIDPSDENAVKYGWMFLDKAYEGNDNSNNKLKDWMENSYDGTIKIGDEMPWTNGSRASTIMEYNDLIGKEVLAPIYEVINFEAGKNKKEDIADVRIVGFVMIKVEPFEPGGSKNKTMRATFVKYANITGLPSDDEEIVEYRVYGSRLVE